jgi:putative ABC transport system permease protein
MLIRDFKIFFSYLYKNKLYTVVTVLGFTISLTFVILLSIYIKNELSINKTQINKNRIYRLKNEKFALSSPPIGNLLQNEIPEIECYTRTFNSSAIITTTNNSKIMFNYLLADSSFFNMFSFKFIEGSYNNALTTKNSIVLTKAFARKLFGNKPALGKQIFININIPCTVTGVIEDISKTSIFKKCDAVINFKTLADIWNAPDLLSNYGICSFGLYLMKKKNTDLYSKKTQILTLFKDKFWIYKNKLVKDVILEPFDDVYFSNTEGVAIRQNSKTFILILTVIVIMILILSIINYINLTVAQAGMRIKETAIKKLVGSSQKRLIIQHTTESVLLCYIAFLFAFVLSFIAEPVFNNLLNTQLNLSNKFSGNFIIIITISVGLIGIISGIIPASAATRLNTVEVLKGGFRRKTKTVYSKILITFQYITVIVLLISTIVIYKQTKFMLTYNPGFNTRNIMSLENMLSPDQYDGFKNKLKNIPGIKNISFVAGNPTDGGNNNTFVFNNKTISFQVFAVDSAFFDMMNLKITPTGNAYSKNGIWINKTAVKALNFDTIPKSVDFMGTQYKILGIVNDFNYRSLHKKVGPAFIKQISPSIYAWNILIQLEGKNLGETIDKIKTAYSEYFDGIPAEFYFFDETVRSWYNKEKRTAKIIGYFTFLTIVISVMGIFAMSIFYNQQKTKEIGIRKVNGATTTEIIKMLNADFVKLVTIAFIIAVPTAYYVMNNWLQNFAYKISLSWWIFALAGLTTTLIALLTVSLQTYNAANKNPVESLRYE